MKGGRRETTYTGCKAQLLSKRGTDATSTPTSQEKNGGQKRGRPVDCTVRTGCKPVMMADVVKPYGQVLGKKQDKVVERNKTC